MKSLLAPPPPLVLGSASDVLPSPSDPIALEVELVELVELDDEEVEGVLPVVVVLPRRLVAAVKADDAFGAELEEDELEELELDEVELDEVELGDEAEEVLLEVAVVEEPRP